MQVGNDLKNEKEAGDEKPASSDQTDQRYFRGKMTYEEKCRRYDRG